MKLNVLLQTVTAPVRGFRGGAISLIHSHIKEKKSNLSK